MERKNNSEKNMNEIFFNNYDKEKIIILEKDSRKYFILKIACWSTGGLTKLDTLFGTEIPPLDI